MHDLENYTFAKERKRLGLGANWDDEDIFHGDEEPLMEDEGNNDANARRDQIAENMWADYQQRHLEQNLGDDDNDKDDEDEEADEENGEDEDDEDHETDQ
ncbi:hypothetical protein A0H81_01779 [Grifola frondosa]|uniref:Uncharacterized protein n=1 Tax=Grifola frondosa TaxID=5627 RepID=A0A1C7MMV3_GRIFR|nr:hypothetical protein A0H81_01779 [Grifola frondosa]